MAEKTYSTKFSGTTLSLVDEDIQIDTAKANRSIRVTSIPEGTTAQELVIHFQRKKNGGSDVDEIVMNKQGSAVITFDKAEGNVSVANCRLLVGLRPTFFSNYCFCLVLRNEMLDDDYICIFARKTKVLKKRLFWEKRLKSYMAFKGRN